MDEGFPFLAGALFKWTSMETPQSVRGRVFLLVQCGDAAEALEMRGQLANKPELFVELLDTMRPWDPDMITVNDRMLNENTSIKDIFPYESE